MQMVQSVWAMLCQATGEAKKKRAANRQTVMCTPNYEIIHFRSLKLESLSDECDCRDFSIAISSREKLCF